MDESHSTEARRYGQSHVARGSKQRTQSEHSQWLPRSLRAVLVRHGLRVGTCCGMFMKLARRVAVDIAVIESHCAAARDVETSALHCIVPFET